jgi:hypothetical protein
VQAREGKSKDPDNSSTTKLLQEILTTPSQPHDTPSRAVAQPRCTEF